MAALIGLRNRRQSRVEDKSRSSTSFPSREVNAEISPTLSRILQLESDQANWILEEVIEGVRVFRYTADPVTFKAVVLLDCSPGNAESEILSHSFEWELHLVSHKKLSITNTSNEPSERVYLSYKPASWWLWPRDYCIVEASHSTSDDSTPDSRYVIQSSTDDNFISSVPGYVRASLSCGYCIAGYREKSVLTFIGSYEYKGWVPKQLTRPLLNQRLKSIAALRAFIQTKYLAVQATHPTPIDTNTNREPSYTTINDVPQSIPKETTIDLKDETSPVKNVTVVGGGEEEHEALPYKNQEIGQQPVSLEAESHEKSDKVADVAVVRVQPETQESPAKPAPRHAYSDEIDRKKRLLLLLSAEKEGWELIAETNGVTIKRKSVPSLTGTEGALIIRGDTVVDVPALAFVQALREVDSKLQWDTMVAKTGRIEMLDDVTAICYDEYKAVWPTTARDMCYIGHNGKEGDLYFALGFSVEHEAAPLRKDRVRVNLAVGGWVFEPMEDVSKTKVCFIAQADLGGSLPGFLKNKVAIEQPLAISRLTAVVKRRDLNPFIDQQKKLKAEQEQLKLNKDTVSVTSHEMVPVKEVAESRLAVVELFTDDASSKMTNAPTPSVPPSPIQHADLHAQLQSVEVIERLDLEQEQTTTPTPTPIPSSAQTNNIDWSVVNSLPSNRYRPLIEESVQGLYEVLTDLPRSNAWSSVSKKYDVIIFRRETAGSPFITQIGTGLIHADAEDIIDMLLQVRRQPEWDAMFKEGRIVEELDQQTAVVHATFETRMCILKTARDFCYVRFFRKEQNGSYVMCARSVIHPQCPEVKGVTRGEILASGWLVKPRKTTPPSCVVSYVTQVDPKGIPAAVANVVQEKQPLKYGKAFTNNCAANRNTRK